MNNAQQQLGRECYKRKEYQKALDYFDLAIGRAASVQLHDQRAACHDKLNDFPAALKDAKKAIQLGREDPTGYLRAGSILVKMEKKSVAREIYAMGLKAVKHVGLGYETLQRRYDALLAEFEPNRTDPFTVLPRELGLAIMELLTFRERAGIMRTSKSWRDFIRSEPRLWSHLDFSAAGKKVSTFFVSRAINTAGPSITTVTLHKMHFKTEAIFKQTISALARLPCLHCLSLLEVGIVSPDVVSGLKPSKSLRHIKIGTGAQVVNSAYKMLFDHFVPQIDQLELVTDNNFSHPLDLELRHFVTLKLTVPDLSPQQFINLQNALLNARALQSFTLHEVRSRSSTGPRRDLMRLDLRSCTNLQELHLHGAIARASDIQYPPAIRKLHLTSVNSTCTNFFGNVVAGLPTGPRFHFDLTALEDLELHLPYVYTSDIFEALQHSEVTDGVDPPHRLRRLYLSAHRHHTRESIDVPFQHARLNEVVSLGLRDDPDLDDDTLAAILRHFPRLRALDVSRCRITGVAVKDIVVRHGAQELVVNDCYSIDRDAIDWARAKGVKVQARMNIELPGGKKVRF